MPKSTLKNQRQKNRRNRLDRRRTPARLELERKLSAKDPERRGPELKSRAAHRVDAHMVHADVAATRTQRGDQQPVGLGGRSAAEFAALSLARALAAELQQSGRRECAHVAERLMCVFGLQGAAPVAAERREGAVRWAEGARVTSMARELLIGNVFGAADVRALDNHSADDVLGEARTTRIVSAHLGATHGALALFGVCQSFFFVFFGYF